MSSLRSARALPNDYWTAETVEDYMRCKVKNSHTPSFLYSYPIFLGDQLPHWSSKPDGKEGSFQDLDSFEVGGRKGELLPILKEYLELEFFHRRKTRRCCLFASTTEEHRRSLK